MYESVLIFHIRCQMDEASHKLQTFLKAKQVALGRDDLSRKGSIDEPIRDLVEIINNDQYYYTTSTCSGRITLIEKAHGEAGKKKGSKFHLSTHETIKSDKLKEVVRTFVDKCKKEAEDEQCLWFKFEPFILHIQCYDLEKAKSLLNAALQTGCRNSGLTVGKMDKIMIAIRSTSSMEVPIYCSSRFEVSDAYIEFLIEEGNRRLTENFVRLAKLHSETTSLLISK